MDPIIKHIIDTAGDAGIQQAVVAVLMALALGGKKALSAREKRQLEKAAEKMVQAATTDDLERAEPLYRTLDRLRAPAKTAAPKEGAAYKKAAPGWRTTGPVRKGAARTAAPMKRAAYKKAAPKAAGKAVKKAPVKKRTVKKAAPAKRGR